VNARLDEMLSDANPKAIIDRHEFCPFHPDASIDKYRQDSHLRKPRPGMIHQAAEALALDLTRSWVVGDAPRDIEAGKAAGCRTILFTDSSLKVSPAALAERNVEPDYICSTLAEAMDFIERNTERPPADDETPEPAAAATSPPPPPAPPPPAPPPPPSAERKLTSIEKLMARAAAQSADLPPPPATPTKPAAQPAARRAIATEASTESEAAPIPASAPAPAPTSSSSSSSSSSSKLESIALDILHELRRRHDQPPTDFSVSKLLAGITQVLVLAMLFVAFLNRATSHLNSMLLFALTLQVMTISLLIMQRQR
jgi:D-glycero-D-manno-heptose 1,7-bisphosphate phosphatase